VYIPLPHCTAVATRRYHVGTGLVPPFQPGDVLAMPAVLVGMGRAWPYASKCMAA
jgi:hypothetical protein